MNLNKLFDKIPYGTFANFTPAYFWGMGAALVEAIVVASYFLLLSPNIDEMAQLDKKIEESSKKLDLYLTEDAKKRAEERRVGKECRTRM